MFETSNGVCLYLAKIRLFWCVPFLIEIDVSRSEACVLATGPLIDCRIAHRITGEDDLDQTTIVWALAGLFSDRLRTGHKLSASGFRSLAL